MRVRVLRVRERDFQTRARAQALGKWDMGCEVVVVVVRGGGVYEGGVVCVCVRGGGRCGDEEGPVDWVGVRRFIGVGIGGEGDVEEGFVSSGGLGRWSWKGGHDVLFCFILFCEDFGMCVYVCMCVCMCGGMGVVRWIGLLLVVGKGAWVYNVL